MIFKDKGNEKIIQFEKGDKAEDKQIVEAYLILMQILLKRMNGIEFKINGRF